MNFIDILLILLFISALLRGIELGFVRQLCSTVGLIAGVVLGAVVQGRLIGLAHRPDTKALLVLIVMLASISICVVLGEYGGVRLKQRLIQAKLKLLNSFDRAAGAVVSGATLLLATWLIASIFAGSGAPWLQRQVKGSVVVAGLNKTLPPVPNVVARLGHLIDPNGFPEVFTGLEPKIKTDQPLPSIGDLDPAVQHARASVVKIEGEGCGGISQGTGFVADNDIVITNAHVVAGVPRPFVFDASGRHTVQVLRFDPDLDIAVLRADHLAGAPLKIETGVVADGTGGATIGYPGGTLNASPAVVVESFKAVGRNIYNQGETTRDIYSLKASVHPGSSGGPLIDKEGDVIGVIFAESTSYDGVGYALTTDPVVESLNIAKDRAQTVATGSCTQ